MLSATSVVALFFPENLRQLVSIRGYILLFLAEFLEAGSPRKGSQSGSSLLARIGAKEDPL